MIQPGKICLAELPQVDGKKKRDRLLSYLNCLVGIIGLFAVFLVKLTTWLLDLMKL
ncbi:hypothetical protein [Leptospira meyeri]|uniref:hypothetical protein n=1 Tax=Leptospira meyeri TaxID=29508 RepID=UPI00223DDD65|nr:hypothetical protein [Leptospira meyeri]MCW7487784.1 hypothetical protein [Leptospira meyeri]